MSKINQNPLVSVVIVNWNGMQWLSECVGSVMSQTYAEVEIIVVDNGSTDDSVVYLKREFPTVKLVLNDSNLGFATGVNTGIDVANGELVMLVNTDTKSDLNLIEKLVRDLQSRSLDVVGPYEASYDGKPRDPYTTLIDNLGHPVYINGSKRNFFLTGVCLLFAKKMYEDTGGLDNDFFMYCEEIDWFWRLNLAKKKIDYTPGAYINHHGSGSAGKGIRYNTFLWRNQNTLQMLLKNYSVRNLLWVIPCYVIINIIEMVFFLIILKPKISLSYILGYWYNIRNAKSILQKRRIVQGNRVISDREIRSLMFKGSAKLNHLFVFAGLKKEV